MDRGRLFTLWQCHPPCCRRALSAVGAYTKANRFFNLMGDNDHEIKEILEGQSETLLEMKSSLDTAVKAVGVAVASVLAITVIGVSTYLLTTGKLSEWAWIMMVCICLSPYFPATNMIIRKIAGADKSEIKLILLTILIPSFQLGWMTFFIS